MCAGTQVDPCKLIPETDLILALSLSPPAEHLPTPADPTNYTRPTPVADPTHTRMFAYPRILQPLHNHDPRTHDPRSSLQIGHRHRRRCHY